MKKENFPHLHLFHCNVSGFTYYDGADVFKELEIGTDLTLVREDDNAYDPNAIALYYKDHKIGFIPRDYNEKIVDFVDMGYTNIFRVTINRINPNAHPENQLGIIVRLVRNAENRAEQKKNQTPRKGSIVID